MVFSSAPLRGLEDKDQKKFQSYRVSTPFSYPHIISKCRGVHQVVIDLTQAGF